MADPRSKTIRNRDFRKAYRFAQQAILSTSLAVGSTALPVNFVVGQELMPHGSDSAFHFSDGPTSDAERQFRRSTVEQRLTEMLEMTDRVRQQLRERSQAATSTATPHISGDPIDTDPKPMPNQTQTLAEIRERLQLLSTLRKENAKANAAASAIPRDNSMLQVTDPDSDTSNPFTDDPAASSRAVGGVQPRSGEPTADNRPPTLVAMEANLAESGNDQPGFPAAESALEATQVLSGPVNAMQLGQSLYRTKNYDAALKALSTVRVETLTEADKLWLELLTALAERRVGDASAAEGKLRDLVNAKSRDPTIPVARWWLKQTNFINETVPILEQISVELDALVERSKSYDAAQ